MGAGGRRPGDRGGLPAGDVADGLWATRDFLPSQAFQAVGQCLALTALVVLAVREITPASAVSIGALIQVGRLLGGEVGTAFMQTFVRMREQVQSNLLGLHVDPLAPATAERLDLYRDTLATSAGEAAVLAYIDGFAAAAIGAIACILLAGWLASAPGPRS